MPLELTLTPVALLTAFGIFAARVVSIAMDTLRFMLTMRGEKTISWIMGFLQSVIFVVLTATVLQNMSSVINIVAYSAGYATGNSVGMLLEKRMAIGFSHISVISRQRGLSVAEALRARDYAVTEVPARGKDGTVAMLHVTIRRKEAPDVEKLILEQDPDAFITVEDIKPLRSGYWGGPSGRHQGG